MTRKQKDITETSVPERKGYKKPRLVVYGDLRDLTMGIGGTHFDPGHDNTSKKGT